jgi:protein SCO1/2
MPVLPAALAVAALVAILAAGCGGGGSPAAVVSRPSTFAGAELPLAPPPRSFTLTDQEGRRVSLRDYRGRVTVLTFLYSRCGGPCDLIAQQIRGALDQLGHPAPVLIVTVDPAGDTPARVRRFLAGASLAGRAEYLTGAPARLRSVWREFAITPASAGRAAFALHASVLLLDSSGRRRVLYQQEQLTPEALAHDIGKLEGG